MDCYAKGNVMSFEMMEEEKECMEDIRYLLPKETGAMQKIVEDVCDRMEQDGSMMYDFCPDKVSFENLARLIANKNSHGQFENDRDYIVKLQMLLCVEFFYRRQRRKQFKDHLSSKN